MPRLVAERLGEGLAEHDAAILGRVVEVDVQVALGVAASMSISEWRASCSSMWSRKPTPVAMS